MRDKKGFTLLELMIVMAIIGILVTLAQPTFKHAGLKAKETALKENLFNMRSVIDQYYADNGKYPDSLNDLVDKGYLRSIPVDSFTGKNDWNPEFYAGGTDSTDTGGIFDVHSYSETIGTDGKPYREW
jgi:general secretion pathway protein G